MLFEIENGKFLDVEKNYLKDAGASHAPWVATHPHYFFYLAKYKSD
jgi:hypothetical protein